MDLFEKDEREKIRRAAPLAVRMRPQTLDEFVGQEHFMGPGKLLRRMLDADRLQSVVFYGPPGTGKTTLAEIISNVISAHFVGINAAASSVKEVREILGEARAHLAADGRRTVLFIDEVHRFNRGQQDVLLSDVEDGVVILIGVTTANPFFALNSPLVSRSQIFRFEPLSEENIKTLLARALAEGDRGLGRYDLEVGPGVLEHWARVCDGDARRALTALEVAVLSQLKGAEGQKAERITIDLAVAEESIQQKALVYDGTGDEHYDAASAFIKSMRGSDPDAAIYWMARMLEAGEEPRFIARRLVICASEDVGNADPLALVVATSALAASEFVGLPESKIPLAQAVIYVACAPKSNASYMAIASAEKDVKENRTIPVPKHLRDANYPGAKRLGHGSGYKYAHSFDGGVAQQDYLGVDKTYYKPTDRGFEAKIRKRLAEYERLRTGGKGKASTPAPETPEQSGNKSKPKSAPGKGKRQQKGK